MKKIFLLIFVAFIGISELAFAQNYPVFSSSLGGGSSGYRASRYTMYRPNRGGRATPVRQTIRSKKTIIKYDANQLDPTRDQIEKLMPSIKRIQDGKVSSCQLVGIAQSYSTASRRLVGLKRILESYSSSLVTRDRIISGPAVVSSNDNTVELIEYY